MFGYVRAFAPELKVRENETYKAVYCTLCRELGRSFGLLSRLTLSYDFTFLALLRLATEDSCTGFVSKHCTFNPLKKCNFCKNTGNILEPVAAAEVIMAYYKLLDNIADGGFFGKIGCTLIRPFFASWRRRAARKYPKIEKAVSEYIKQQQAVESNGCDSIDRAAEPTARALSYIFSVCSDNDREVRVLERMGYLAGKWVYLIDALADMDEDLKSGGYNVLLRTGQGEDEVKERVVCDLNVCIGELGKTYDLLGVRRYDGILRNIIYLGLPHSIEQTVNKKEKKHERSV